MIGKHLRDIWEASGRHLGSKGTPRRHPGGTQEAPRGTQGPQESPGGLGSKKVNTSQLKCKKIENMTISRNVFEGRCHQVPRLLTKSIRDPPRRKGQTTKGSLPKPPEPLQMKSVWGTSSKMLSNATWFRQHVPNLPNLPTYQPTFIFIFISCACTTLLCMLWAREPRGQGLKRARPGPGTGPSMLFGLWPLGSLAQSMH